MLREQAKILNMDNAEWVALNGGGHSLGRMHADRAGFPDGSWTSSWTTLNNDYFKELIAAKWTRASGGADMKDSYVAESTLSPGTTLRMLQTDMLLKWNADYLAIAQHYASDEGVFLDAFAAAWTKLVNADRFEGSAGNACAFQPAASNGNAVTAFEAGMITLGVLGAVALLGAAIAIGVAVYAVMKIKKRNLAVVQAFTGQRAQLESTSLLVGGGGVAGGERGSGSGNRPVSMSEQELPKTNYTAMES